MNPETIIPAGQPGAQPIASGASDPKGTASNVVPESLTLNELNEFLGKTYPDKTTALKSLKDTFSYVGKKIEAAAPVAPTTDADVVAQLREMKTEFFYAKNPQYESLRAVIGKMGENPSDVVNSPEFKTIFDKTSGYDKIQKSKTVLESNPRIGQVRSKMAEAKEATGKRDYTTGTSKAVQAVLEATESN